MVQVLPGHAESFVAASISCLLVSWLSPTFLHPKGPYLAQADVATEVQWGSHPPRDRLCETPSRAHHQLCSFLGNADDPKLLLLVCWGVFSFFSLRQDLSFEEPVLCI